MYKIEYQNDKIKSLTIDGADIEMMKYSENLILYNLYQFCDINYDDEICDSITIYNNDNEQNEFEIMYILQSDWLIDEDNLSIEYAKDKLKNIKVKLNELYIELTDENIFYNAYIDGQIRLYEYTKRILEEYLRLIKLEKFISNRKKKIRSKREASIV